MTDDRTSRYRPLRDLTQVGATRVLVAMDQWLGESVVLKVAPSGSREAEGIALEGARLADLRHPRLVRFHHRFEGLPGFGDVPHTGLATRWIDGDPFDRALRGASLEERLRVVADIVSAVAFLHRRQLLHLDLKPANVVVDDHGATLLDLGSAQPSDAGPGEAGGTLGWAAPEVLAGGAATEASDAFGIGALMYLALTGARPHAGLEGAALRRAALVDTPTPARALAPDAPRELARLVDRLLSPAPERRPDLGAIAELLGQHGAPVDLDPGEPAFVGRTIEVDTLKEALADVESSLVALVGPTGSGRTRLARRVLEASHPGNYADLSHVADVSLALHRVLTAFGQRVPPFGPGWATPWTPTGMTRGPRTMLLLPARELWRPGDVPDVLAALPRLARAGLGVVVGTPTPMRAARNVQLSPLDDDELRHLAWSVASVRSSVADEAARNAAGWPGPLLDLLASGRDRIAALAPEVRAVYDALATLPTPFPADALPFTASNALPRLSERHLVALHGDGTFTVPDAPTGPIAPAMAPVVEAALQRGRLSDPTARSVALVRLGRPDEAAPTYPVLVSTAEAAQIKPLIEVGVALVAAGHDAARLPLARLYVRDQRLDDAWAVSGHPDPELAAFRVNLRLRQNRPSDARALLTEARERFGDHPALLVEAAREAITAAEYERSNELVKAAARAGAPDEAILAIRLLGALRSPVFGGDLDALVAKAEGLPHLEPGVMIAIASVLASQSRFDARMRVLSRAITAADRLGDTANGVGARAALGAAMYTSGRISDARSVWVEALAMARAHKVVRIETRVAYNLCELELRAGRLSAAERFAAVLDRVAASMESDRDTEGRIRLLRAQVALAKEDPRAALGFLAGVTDERHRVDRDLLAGKAHLALGEPDEALAAVSGLPKLPPELDRTAKVIAGRAHVAIGRRTLRKLAEVAPEDPDSAQRLEVGELLLAAGSEDLTPDDIVTRREYLARASRLLRGSLARRAEEIRERMLDSPTASLDAIVELTKAVHEPATFPEVLARVVATALGANRVLILVRLPGMGQQVKFRDIARNEAAGIAHEVMDRIRTPTDVWIADDAFADPMLREVSLTVRTFELKSLVAVAIPRNGEAIGALYVDDVHVTGRFGPTDVEQLHRLAGAIGQMVTLMEPIRPGQLKEPRDVHGVLLQDADQAERLDSTLRRLRDQRSSNLLITGPTGAGKTYFARAVAQDVLGLDGIVEVPLRRGDVDKLIGVLSGTRRGDYTGAVDQMGAIEQALKQNKALFLDEVHTLDEVGQTTLLPLLELPKRRFGGLLGAAQHIDRPLHVLLATNIDPRMWERHFRGDFWYRMISTTVDLPPLEARGSEVVYRYLQRMLARRELPVPETVFEPAALQAIAHHTWPGNLRELETFAAAASGAYRDLQRQITTNDLLELGLGDPDVPHTGRPLEDLTKRTVMDALRRAGWNQSKAAASLGMSKHALLRRLNRWGLLEEVQARRREERPGRSRDEDDE